MLIEWRFFTTFDHLSTLFGFFTFDEIAFVLSFTFRLSYLVQARTSPKAFFAGLLMAPARRCQYLASFTPN